MGLSQWIGRRAERAEWKRLERRLGMPVPPETRVDYLFCRRLLKTDIEGVPAVAYVVRDGLLVAPEDGYGDPRFFDHADLVAIRQDQNTIDLGVEESETGERWSFTLAGTQPRELTARFLGNLGRAQAAWKRSAATQF